MKATKAERRMALLHATAHEHTGHCLMEQSGRRQDINRDVAYTMAVMMLTLGGEYRRIGYGGEIDE